MDDLHPDSEQQASSLMSVIWLLSMAPDGLYHPPSEPYIWQAELSSHDLANGWLLVSLLVSGFLLTFIVFAQFI